MLPSDPEIGRVYLITTYPQLFCACYFLIHKKTAFQEMRGSFIRSNMGNVKTMKSLC
jgi:hypothetical protein